TRRDATTCTVSPVALRDLFPAPRFIVVSLVTVPHRRGGDRQQPEQSVLRLFGPFFSVLSMLDSARRILLELADVPASQRMAWISRRCAGDQALFAEVQALVDQMEAPDEGRPDAVPGRWLAPGTVIDDFTI